MSIKGTSLKYAGFRNSLSIFKGTVDMNYDSSYEY